MSSGPCVVSVRSARSSRQLGFPDRQCAKIAGDAESFISVGIDIEPWCAPKAFSYSGPLRRILLRVDVLRILVAERDPQRLKQINQQDLLEESAHKVPQGRGHALYCISI